MEGEKKTAGVIAPPPLMLLISLILGFVISAAAPLELLSRLPAGGRYAVGGAVSLAAIALALIARRRFAAAQTPVNPYFPPSALVTSGIFERVRNPMYVSFYVLSLGLAIAFAAEGLILTTVILAVAIHYGVILREEKFLEGKFSEDYLAYRAKVPRYGWRF